MDIRLKEVLKKMKTGSTFSISFITLDKKPSRAERNGRIRNIDKAKLVAAKGKYVAKHHYSTRTRNLKDLQRGVIFSLNIFLITKFNGRNVIR